VLIPLRPLVCVRVEDRDKGRRAFRDASEGRRDDGGPPACLPARPDEAPPLDRRRAGPKRAGKTTRWQVVLDKFAKNRRGHA